MKIEIYRKKSAGKEFVVQVRDPEDKLLEQTNYHFKVKKNDVISILKMHYSDLYNNKTTFETNDHNLSESLKTEMQNNQNIRVVKTNILRNRQNQDINAKIEVNVDYYSNLRNQLGLNPFILNISYEKESKKTILTCSKINGNEIVNGRKVILNNGAVIRKDKINDFFKSMDEDFIGKTIVVNDSSKRAKASYLEEVIKESSGLKRGVYVKSFNKKYNPGDYRNGLAKERYDDYLKNLDKELSKSSNNVLFVDGGRKEGFNVSSYVMGNNNHYYGKSFVRKQDEMNYEEFALLHGLKELFSKDYLLENKTHIVCDYDQLDWFYNNIKNTKLLKEKLPNVVDSVVYKDVLKLMEKPHKKIYIHFVKSHTKDLLSPLKFGNNKVDKINSNAINDAIERLDKLNKFSDFYMTNKVNLSKEFNAFFADYRKRNKKSEIKDNDHLKNDKSKNNKIIKTKEEPNIEVNKLSFSNHYGNENLFSLKNNLEHDKSLVFGRYGNRCFEIHKIENNEHTMEIYQRDFDNLNPDDAIKDFHDFLIKHPIPEKNKLIFSVPDNYVQKSLGLTLRGLSNKECSKVSEMIYKYNKDNILMIKNKDWTWNAIEKGIDWYNSVLEKSREVKPERKRKSPKI